MIDSSEKRNRQLALNFRIRMFVKSVVTPTLLNDQFKLRPLYEFELVWSLTKAFIILILLEDR